MSESIIFCASWLGSLTIAAAYVLLTIGKLDGEGRLYPSLGIFGGALIAATSYPLGAMQPVVFNSIWVGISLMALLSIPLPRIIATLKPVYLSAIGLFLATSGSALAAMAGIGFFSLDLIFIAIIGGMASASIAIFLGVYLLFTQGKISERSFYLHNLLGNCLFIGILIETGNTPVMCIVALATFMSFYGLNRLKKNESDLVPANA